jgi:hypothetical protein
MMLNACTTSSNKKNENGHVITFWFSLKIELKLFCSSNSINEFFWISLKVELELFCSSNSVTYH